MVERTSRRMRRLLVLGLVAVLALTGCGGGSVAETTAGTTTSPKDSNFVYVSNLDIITDWDPATSYSNEVIAMQNIYESLTRYDITTKKVKPLLATKWASSPDGKTWTFTLRDGVKFHDVNALT